MGAYAYGIFIYAIESIQCAHMNVCCANVRTRKYRMDFCSFDGTIFFLSFFLSISSSSVIFARYRHCFLKNE